MAQPQMTMTLDRADEFGRELDAIRARVLADLGKRDADYIRRVVRVQRILEVCGRVLLFAGILRPAWLAGTAMLGLSKILNTMEIGHNVMHGQYDWMGDPDFHGPTFEWDASCPADLWRHSHNYVHHTNTNIAGADRDIGYGVMRISKSQPWDPYYLGNPFYALLVMVLFEYAVTLHNLEADRILNGEIKFDEKREAFREIRRKIRRQAVKEYVAYPLLAGPFAPWVFAGNLAANLIRNVWAFIIIFCGHFPDDAVEFAIEETRNESRGMWYYRQMAGSANVSGSRLFHLLAGNLSYHVEHHLFPDLPAHRYAEIAPEVRDICRRYDVPYNTGRLHRQFGTVVRKIFRLALP